VEWKPTLSTEADIRRPKEELLDLNPSPMSLSLPNVRAKVAPFSQKVMDIKGFHQSRCQNQLLDTLIRRVHRHLSTALLLSFCLENMAVALQSILDLHGSLPLHAHIAQ
jgi:hypothetical protein